MSVIHFATCQLENFFIYAIFLFCSSFAEKWLIHFLANLNPFLRPDQCRHSVSLYTDLFQQQAESIVGKEPLKKGVAAADGGGRQPRPGIAAAGAQGAGGRKGQRNGARSTDHGKAVHKQKRCAVMIWIPRGPEIYWSLITARKLINSVDQCVFMLHLRIQLSNIDCAIINGREIVHIWIEAQDHGQPTKMVLLKANKKREVFSMYRLCQSETNTSAGEVWIYQIHRCPNLSKAPAKVGMYMEGKPLFLTK